MFALLVHHINWPLVETITERLGFALITGWAFLATKFASSFSEEADRYRANSQTWERRWNEHRCVQRDNAQAQQWQMYAQEWQNRYELQLQRCAVEHVERPLPTAPLSAEQAQQLGEEMPF